MFVCPACGISTAAPGFCTEHGVPLESNAADPLLGQQLGSYRIARLIGRGGMGEVYLGVHPGIGSRVAIKILSNAASEDRSLVDRFLAEARAANLVRHEGIVNVLDLALMPDGRPYIVMEHLDGAPLTAHLRQGVLPVGTAARLIAQALEALAAAHAAGVTHRDLKPDNLFVTTLGRPKLLDFGIAKLRPELGGGSDATRTGSLLGTPHYMSPEQAMGRPVDFRTDIYSMGVILYEAVTGRRPFDAPSLFELLRLHVEATPAPPRATRPDLPPAFEAAILRALEKDPARRFGSALELGRALEDAVSHLPATSFAPLTGPAPSLPAGPTPRYDAALPSPALPSPGHASPAGWDGRTPVLPTTSDFGNTVGTSARRSRAPALWIALGAVALVVVVGVSAAIGAGVTLLGSRETADRGERGNVPPTALPRERAGAPSATSKTGALTPFTLNPRKFDLQPFLPHAQSRARARFQDAELSVISLIGVASDGTLDLTDEGTVSVVFVSPSKARKVEPSAGGGPRLGECAVAVIPTEDGVIDSVPPVHNCASPTTGLPKCGLRQVLEKAAGGKPPNGAIVTFNASGPSGRSWTVIFEEGMSVHVVPDTC